ncbi:hypothetical protein J5Y09_08275 [Roseomonas sp. PWR1]|uniref:Uncharacterized protein n=1 Tax=Roseomonas nitratireducens TaxID=2820810 RepID=A0ABS4ASS7_9PROT|nr:hypothetical protein [Neoroseomonas nitratireducens]MBP0463903.1 hypothetical protein [Neoroseomonas nitratireducens]
MDAASRLARPSRIVHQRYHRLLATSGKAKSACDVRHATARAVRRRVPPPPNPVSGSGSIGSRVASGTRAIHSSDGSATRGDPSRTNTRFTVMAVHKAPLDAAVSATPGVSCRQASAFGLVPPAGSAGRLVVLGLHLLSGPRARLGAARNFVRRLKFQSETDHATATKFDAISGACLFHGYQNRQNPTFSLLH